MEASPHPAMCCSCSPLVHLDRVLQVSPFQPHQPPQKKTHPSWMKFLGPAPYASPSPFPFLDSSRIWTTSPSSPGSFSASSSVSATSSSSKEGSSWLDQSKMLAPAPYASSTFCLFSEPSCPRPPSCVSNRFFSSVSSFLRLRLREDLFVARISFRLRVGSSETRVTSEKSLYNSTSGIVSNAQILQRFLCIGTI